MDLRLYRDVNRLAVHSGWAHGTMKALAVYGVGAFALLVLAAWWRGRSSADAPRAAAAAIWTAGATVLAVAVNQPVAHAFHRARPFTVFRGAEVLVPRSHDYSFPSDHTIAAAAAATGLWLVARYAGPAVRVLAGLGTVLALLVAFSRVYVGAHYPGDVAAALVLGTAVSLVGWLVLGRPLARLTSLAAAHRPWDRLVIRPTARQAA